MRNQQKIHSSPATQHLGGNSRSIHSSQEGVHPNLVKLLKRQAGHTWHAPVQNHSQLAFDEVKKWLMSSAQCNEHELLDQSIILDTGCGVGRSTAVLAEKYSDHFVIGIDKSAQRLTKQKQLPNNAFMVRADLVDFWRLAAADNWQLAKHYFLYPNPWPKPGHLQRRWQAHPVFATIVKLGGDIECRSNWKLYLEEFSIALDFYKRSSELATLPVADQPITPFEQKYQASGQTCWQLLSSAN